METEGVKDYFSNANIKNWERKWLKRSETVASLIATLPLKEFTLFDIGCGDMALESFLKEQKLVYSYTPSDFTKRDSRTIVLDINNRKSMMMVGDYDIITMLGVAEHIIDLTFTLQTLLSRSQYIIFTYLKRWKNSSSKLIVRTEGELEQILVGLICQYTLYKDDPKYNIYVLRGNK